MNAGDFTQLYDYNVWANMKLLDCASNLTPEQLKQDNNYSIGSVRGQLVHLMGVEYWWIDYLVTGEEKYLEQEFESLDEIRAFWETMNATNRAYIVSLTPTELARVVKPVFWDATAEDISVSLALTHIMNHSTDHRAQTLQALHALGAPTFEQDFLYYLIDR